MLLAKILLLIFFIIRSGNIINTVLGLYGQKWLVMDSFLLLAIDFLSFSDFQSISKKVIASFLLLETSLEKKFVPPKSMIAYFFMSLFLVFWVSKL